MNTFNSMQDWAADRFEALAHLYQDDKLSDVADHCKDAVRRLHLSQAVSPQEALQAIRHACEQLRGRIRTARERSILDQCLAELVMRP